MAISIEELLSKSEGELLGLLRNRHAVIEKLITPREARAQVPASKKALARSLYTRYAIQDILNGNDSRMILYVGPCSVHDPKAFMDYVRMIKEIDNDPAINSQFLTVVRTYIEKPRTIDGWKGLLIDIHMDGSHDINQGLLTSRRIFRDTLEEGLGTTTEVLGGISVNWYDELLCCGSVGARNVESQPNREVTSGLSFPMSIKNATNGDFMVAIDALLASEKPHSFIGVDDDGHVAKVTTVGNDYLTINLRGGNGEPNYKAHIVANVQSQLRARKLRENVVIDCSHGNSEKYVDQGEGQPKKKIKDYMLQPEVFLDVCAQRAAGNYGIVGLMLESYIKGNAQSIPKELTPAWRSGATLDPLMSCTDACIDIDTTRRIIYEGARILASARRH